MIITKETKLRELNEAKIFEQAKNHFIGGALDFFEGKAGERSLQDLHSEQPTWACEDMIYGLERLKEISQEYEKFVYPVYEPKEIEKEPILSEVQLFYFPAKKDRFSDKNSQRVTVSGFPYVILQAGGGYGAVCSMVEAFPVAAKMNEMGITCFCLNYRTVKEATLENGLMPKPMDDMSRAWRFIKQHEKEFHVNAENYIVGGFSAGGHASAVWGTETFGFRKYNIPAPKLLLLVYPLISVNSLKDSPMKTYMLTGMFGGGFTEENINEYSIEYNVDGNYPPVYYVQSMDDDTVPPINAEYMEKAMRHAGILYRMDLMEHGGHGFGLGSMTDGAGWVERFIEFYCYSILE